MKILVTGSEGNIGSELVPYLENKGHEVLCLDFVQKYRKNYILCDINNLSDSDKIVSSFKPEVVYHMAAMVSRITCEESPQIAVNTNITGTMNIINLCRKFGCKLINFSTSEVYGNQNISMDEWVECKPNNVYGKTKLFAENLVSYFACSGEYTYINVRPFMMYSENEVFGENRSAMIRFAENIILNKPITVHKGAKRSWLHISDAVIMLEKMLYLNENVTMNMGNDKFIDIESMAKEMCFIANRYTQDKNNNIFFPLIVFEELPEKMTLSKVSTFKNQSKYLEYEPKVSQSDGILRVMKQVKRRIGDIYE